MFSSVASFWVIRHASNNAVGEFFEFFCENQFNEVHDNKIKSPDPPRRVERWEET